ncbi:FtsQ-type POTRA domain-containing protein [Streptomyces sp. LHD-70]|uniref:cell division protein FtsQ/DivIB n=1 Tax=Streptomyces sp. LHD-70 TaxID=3072140 RepID=UPI00280DFF00|nr:FtsQ-type POTRA domain-containing protein [Streptomyces sp. LHD-70]MDQ8701510.1 FtsQ-type POTRA domain-containing protein [Streptomyces sp. LHD-70]
MAGPTTAERGERTQGDAPARPPRPTGGGRRLRLPPTRTLVVAAVVAVLLGAGVVWLLYGSQWLRVERVKTSGTEVLTSQEVRTAAEVPVGAPLISVDTDAIEDRLRKKLRRIDTVHVVRAWPHGIGLKVTERKPVLLIAKGGKFIEVDAEGVRFATVDRAPKGVPLLELDAAASPSLNRFGTNRLLRAAVQVAADLPASVAKDARIVQVRSYDSISVELKGQRTVAWGSVEKGDAKAASLIALMKAEPKAERYDVSAPTAPAASGS